MLTLIEAISLAGDRAKQNDDAAGATGPFAWVIDGATDLHDAPMSNAASDAAWIAHALNGELQTRLAHVDANDEAVLRAAFTAASGALREQFPASTDIPAWKRPIASALIVAESAGAIQGLDLGDCRTYALDANGAAHAAGGPVEAADRETRFAAEIAKSNQGHDGPLYRAPAALEILRDLRAKQNLDPRAAVFGLDPASAAYARAWTLHLSRPAHIILCTDGFSALVDRYAAYDSASLVRAALEQGLQALGAELRAIENADAGGALHPRWKRSDDATALLLRLA